MIHQSTLRRALPHLLSSIDLPNLGKKHSGKVRDFYIQGDRRILVTTDRLSAFDVILGLIPYKGAVLTGLSKFWFAKTKNIIPNHLISVPDPNVIIAKNCQAVPVEMVVRGYMTGVTTTSIWYSYERGERLIYGLKFPDGLKKNDPLPKPVITPTTHPEAGSTVHDERLTRELILKHKLVSPKLYRQMEATTYKLFKFGQQLCARRGLILVDTKYEFGLYQGKLVLIDEIHTPDSSRFWLKKTHENFDKEFLRLWYAKRGYRGDGLPPKMPASLQLAVATRYIKVYEMITGQRFPSFPYPITPRLLHHPKLLHLGKTPRSALEPLPSAALPK